MGGGTFQGINPHPAAHELHGDKEVKNTTSAAAAPLRHAGIRERNDIPSTFRQAIQHQGGRGRPASWNDSAGIKASPHPWPNRNPTWPSTSSIGLYGPIPTGCDPSKTTSAPEPVPLGLKLPGGCPPRSSLDNQHDRQSIEQTKQTHEHTSPPPHPCRSVALPSGASALGPCWGHDSCGWNPPASHPWPKAQKRTDIEPLPACGRGMVS